MDIKCCNYVVERIDGDYAMLRNLEDSDDVLKQTARALLPPEIREGTRLRYEMLQYRIIDSEE